MAPIRSTNPRKFVVEWRYKPNLNFYSQMDQLGLQLINDFPDWKRSALALDVRNKELQRRTFLSVSRSFFESSSSTPDVNEDAYETAVQVFDQVNEKLGISNFVRLGIRQWYALTFDHDMTAMVARLWNRFFAQSKTIDNLLQGKVRDLQYVVDLENDDGWQCHFRVGPMPKEQWFQWVEYEQGIFSPDGFKQYHESFPDRIVFVDLDYFQEDVTRDIGSAAIKQAQRRATQVIKSLVEFYRKG